MRHGIFTLGPEEQWSEIKRGCLEILSEEELFAKIKAAYVAQRPLRVKFGADPSRPDLHLGHCVVLQKLRLLQDLGHHILFLIGDFTAMIGDPTGKDKTRPQLTQVEVFEYAKSYQEQVFRILDPHKTEVVYNSHWLGVLGAVGIVELLASHTVQQILAREDFSQRFKQQSPIYLHECLYPLLQGYDSVHLHADIEFGGSDQRFNLLIGRELQRLKGQKPQSLIMMPLLEGLDGVQKMSKSYDNYIALNDSPSDMFGKVMSINDTLMLRYYELLSAKSSAEFVALKEGLLAERLHPMELKKDLAEELVCQYWGAEAGARERANFTARFSKKATPEDIAVHEVALVDGQLNIIEIALQLGFVASKSEGRRILQQKGMRLDDECLSQERLVLEPGTSHIFRQGKLKIVKLLVL